ncbi:monocarboxylate transporter 12-like isoform X2 [Lineus longissimus]|uniref:monocarboxylate transporter 12-like isoform X2 n=1 Tax=Lineus longissimus TaxID=88925 RepID=UPI002B4EFF7C
MANLSVSRGSNEPPFEITLLTKEDISRDRKARERDGGCFNKDGGCCRRRPCPKAFNYFKGYKAVILFSSFCCYFILCGITLTVGVYFNEWKDDFEAGSALTSWLGSVHIGVLHVVAPLVGILTDRFGFRPMVMIGSVILTASLVATSFAQNIYAVLVSFSIFAAVGGGFVFVPASTIVSLYYEEGRAFSNGFSTCGCGFGQFIMPFILHAGIDAFNWRGSMWISAGLALQICVLGALMREPKIWQKIKKEKARRVKEGNKLEQWGFHIYKSFGFVLLLLQLTLVAAGLSIVYVHISAITIQVGRVTAHEATLPLSLLGFSTIVGRLSAGLISQHRRVDTFIFYISCFIVAGVVTILVPFIQYYGFICFWAVVFGLMTAPSAALVQIMALYFVDVADLNAAFSHAAVFTALGYIIGAPVAGWLFDFTKSYNGSFYLGGSMLVVSGLTLIWPYVRHRLEKRTVAKVDLGDGVEAERWGTRPSIASGVLFGSAFFESYEPGSKERSSPSL